MKITFRDPGFAHSIDSIMLFETGEQGEWWREGLFHFYPQLDRSRADALGLSERRAYYADALRGAYEAGDFARKADAYNAHWAENARQVADALSDAFGVPLDGAYGDIAGSITLNPVCPRFLGARAFDVFHMNSPRGALGMAIHEVIHFLWFGRWRELFRDDSAEYEAPHLKWVLSEMAVEPIMRDERLSSRNPYFPRENGGCVYEYFYDMEIGGAPILDTLNDLYRAGGMRALMEEGYRYCLLHESEIRAHIAGRA